MQAKSSGVTLPEVQGVDKGIDPNIPPEKQVIKPISSEVKGLTQSKPRVVRVEQVLNDKLNFLCPTCFISPIYQ